MTTSYLSSLTPYQLAERGLYVFPCKIDKKPATPHGFHDATCDAEGVRELFDRYPGTLIGIATGARSDLDVLDIDINGGFDWWAHNGRMLPATMTIRTRSGGLHLWFRHSHGLRCSAGAIHQGIDVRADGGYVIAWHAAGFPVVHDRPLAEWPAWLCRMPPASLPRSPEPPCVPDDRRLSALVRFVAVSPVSQRNTRLFWAACRMAGLVASCLLSETDAIGLLVAAAMHAGLPETEARRTAQSGLRAAGAV